MLHTGTLTHHWKSCLVCFCFFLSGSGHISLISNGTRHGVGGWTCSKRRYDPRCFPPPTPSSSLQLTHQRLRGSHETGLKLPVGEALHGAPGVVSDLQSGCWLQQSFINNYFLIKSEDLFLSRCFLLSGVYKPCTALFSLFLCFIHGLSHQLFLFSSSCPHVFFKHYSIFLLVFDVLINITQIKLILLRVDFTFSWQGAWTLKLEEKHEHK